MNAPHAHDLVLPNVLVPASLIRNPDQFCGLQVLNYLSGDLVIRNGRVRGLQPTSGTGPGRLVLPKLTECHVHLDKCHTISRLDSVGGDLRAAIDNQEADKRNWTVQDLRERAERGLGELKAAGCRNVRSHVDWAGTDGSTEFPLAWQVLNEIAQENRDQVRLQISPLIGVDQYRVPGLADQIAAELAKAQGVMGAFVFDQPDRRGAISAVVKAAEKHDLALDFHVDEGLSDGLDGLEIIADAVIDFGYQGPVLCGHACSLMNLEANELQKMTEKLLRAGITIAALPVTNLYLQGRVDGTPDRRGVTRMRELQALGVPVVVGTDNVRDAFCPLGQHNPIESLKQAVLAAHLDPPLAAHLPMITTTAEAALGLSSTHIDGASIEDLISFEAATTADLLSEPAPATPISELLEGEPV